MSMFSLKNIKRKRDSISFFVCFACLNDTDGFRNISAISSILCSTSKH